MSKSYSEKLKDPRWQKKRLEILERDDFTCQSCLETDNTLHVHHKSYYKDREPWDYPNSCFITLCADCHKLEQEVLYETFNASRDLLINSELSNSGFIEICESLHGYNDSGNNLSEILGVCSNNEQFKNSINKLASFLFFADVNVGCETKEYSDIVNSLSEDIENLIEKYRPLIDDE